MLEQLIKSGNLFGYDTDTEDDVFVARGIVIANSEDEAKEKVINAYTKYQYVP